MNEYLHRCRKIDLDKIPSLSSEERADYVLLCGDVAIVIEDTGTAEPRDVEKVRRTVERVAREHILGVELRKIVGVLHGMRIDSMVSRICRQYKVMTAGCRRDLEMKIGKILRALSR